VTRSLSTSLARWRNGPGNISMNQSSPAPGNARHSHSQSAQSRDGSDHRLMNNRVGAAIVPASSRRGIAVSELSPAAANGDQFMGRES
jgi:hypothetical protein